MKSTGVCRLGSSGLCLSLCGWRYEHSTAQHSTAQHTTAGRVSVLTDCDAICFACDGSLV